MRERLRAAGAAFGIMSACCFVTAAVALSFDVSSIQPSEIYRMFVAIGFAFLGMAVSCNYLGQINAK